MQLLTFRMEPHPQETLQRKAWILSVSVSGSEGWLSPSPQVHGERSSLFRPETGFADSPASSPGRSSARLGGGGSGLQGSPWAPDKQQFLVRSAGKEVEDQKTQELRSPVGEVRTGRLGLAGANRYTQGWRRAARRAQGAAFSIPRSHRKERKMEKDVCVWLSHLAAQQKWTHRKSAVLQ